MTWFSTLMRGRSLRSRMVLILALALAPPATLGIGQAYSDYFSERTLLEKNLNQAARLITLEHQNLISNARTALTALSSQPNVKWMLTSVCSEDLRSALQKLPEFTLAVVTDPTGNIKCSSRAINPSINLKNHPWFEAIMSGKDFVVSNLLMNALLPERTVITAIPLFRDDEEITGVVALSLDLSALARLRSLKDAPDGTFLAISDSKGNFLPLSGAFPQSLPSLLNNQSARDSENSVSINRGHGVDGDEFIFTVIPLASNNLFAILGEPSQSLFGWLRVKLATRLAIPTIIWFAAMATAWAATNRLVIRWVHKLRQLAGSFISGRIADRSISFTEAPEELGELARSLTGMMETLDARNAQLSDALLHRDILIKEIHHRIKNNLQIISSLINLQARSLREGIARNVVLGMRSRINALALVHKSLYETEELQVVRLDGFIQPLTTQLQGLMASPDRRINIRTEVPALTVTAETAVTLAMLITEAVTNAFKHAFTDRTEGNVSVILRTNNDGSISLICSDDGVGGFELESRDEEHEGLGRLLIEGYVRQLSGKVFVDRSHGTAIRITLPKLR
ncbi:MAG: sensor histidine kinase [Alphaproteobacteria bacterium]